VFEKIVKEPAYKKVSSVIEDKIMSRNLKPGDSLPSEMDLADQFGLNRSTIREGIRQLEISGLVERRDGSKRLYITRPRTKDMAAGISKAMALHDVTFHDVWEGMMILEPQAAEIAAKRATPDQLQALEDSIEEMRNDLENKDAVVEGAARFFNLLAQSTGNQVLVLNQEPLSHLLKPSLTFMIKRVKQAGPRILEAQEIILNHLRSRNEDQARSWMIKHINDFKRGYALAGIEMDHRVLS
jgi:GntR family transcriptional repressor for pyruvate dehydrogenase complex